MSETTGETTAPVKILQLHGGALNAGGTKGNKGGPGRPPAEIREACAETFYRHMGKAEAILRSKKASNAEKLKALDLLGKYGGLLHTTNETTIQRPHREAVEKVRRELGLAS